MAKEVDSITSWLWNKSSTFLDLEEYQNKHGAEIGEDKYYQDVQDLVAPLNTDPDYGFVSLYDDGEGLGYGLMRIIKAKVDLSVKLILVKIDSYNNNRSSISCTNQSEASYREPEIYGEEFGLHYDSGHTDTEGYHNTTIDFFGENLPPVIFGSFGIQRAPLSNYIDVFLKTDEYFTARGTVFVNVGREAGNVEVVTIEGKTIKSAIPVYVHGTSKDWHLNGDGSCSSCELPAHPWDVDYATHRTRSHWDIGILNGSDGRDLTNAVS
ncbi:MAG: hypothetical protein EBY39_04215 [Flavobacteriia bacterium]|nr:hypothetical protein [Flavobacteriia bacterium]